MISNIAKQDRLYNGLPCVWDGEKYILFSPYSFKVTRLSSEDLENPEVKAKLNRLNFFGTPSPEINDPEIVKVTLIVTTDCNLRCKYCYMEAGSNNHQCMDQELAVNALKGMLKHKPNAREIHITFFGGEPTLNMRSIKETVDFIKSKDFKYKLHVSTNGVFSERILDYLSNNSFDLSISMDGTPDINDQYRIFPDGHGTSKIVEDTIRKVVDRRLRFNIRITVTEANVRNISQTVDYLSSLGVKFVHLELVNVAGRANRTGVRQPKPEAYLKYFRQALDKAEEKGIYIINSTLMNLLTPSTYFCLSVRGGMYIFTPQGYITLCYEVQDPLTSYSDFVIGHVDNDGLKIDYNKLSQMCTLNVDSYEPCKDCFVKYICAGGCPRRNLTMTGTLIGVAPSLCKMRKELLHDAILRIYSASKKGQVSPVFGTNIYENF